MEGQPELSTAEPSPLLQILLFAMLFHPKKGYDVHSPCQLHLLALCHHKKKKVKPMTEFKLENQLASRSLLQVPQPLPDFQSSSPSNTAFSWCPFYTLHSTHTYSCSHVYTYVHIIGWDLHVKENMEGFFFLSLGDLGYYCIF